MILKLVGEFPLFETYDFRPRVSDIAGELVLHCPPWMRYAGNSFDFGSRVFSGTGSSFSNFGKPASNIQSDFEYFLARRASVFLDDRGRMVIQRGDIFQSIQNYLSPINNAMKLLDLSLPPFSFRPQDVDTVSESKLKDSRCVILVGLRRDLHKLKKLQHFRYLRKMHSHLKLQMQTD